NGAAVRGEVAVEQPQATSRLERCGQRMNHQAVGRWRIETGDLLRERLAGTGDAVAVEQARGEELAHDHRESALRVDVDHRVTAEGTDVHQHRQRAGDAVEL